jgi:Domain of unknown function (DUF4157)
VESVPKPSSVCLQRPAEVEFGFARLQRKCACGGVAGKSGECEECRKKRLGLQTKLSINEPGDIYEQEADRIADQVTSTMAPRAVSEGLPRIQRLPGQPAGQMNATPASVDQALASPGMPLEPSLRQDMERRFGHDFSRVRVHSNAAAEQSALEVNAHAYTLGHQLVFGPGQWAPKTQEGRRLIAHELTHVVQQGAAASTPRVLARRWTDQPEMARPAQQAGEGELAEKPSSPTQILQRQPNPGADKDPCPRGEVRLGPGQPCVPLIWPGRKCPIGQVEFAGDCVPLHPRTSPGAPSSPGASPLDASDSGKSARVLKLESMRNCAYAITYSNPRSVDCDTAFRNAKGRNPPAPLCGVSLVYDITAVSATGTKCPRLDGLRITEVVKRDQGCAQGSGLTPGPGCDIGAGGKVTNCTDTFTVCGETSSFVGSGCKEIVDQEIEVGGQLAEVHEITFDLKKSDRNCTGEVHRITGE